MVALAMGPFLNASFGEMIRNPETDGLLMPALLGGYAVISMGLAWLYPRVFSSRPGATELMLFAGVVGLLVCLGDHLVTAGWSRLPAWSMGVSGVLDALAFLPAALPLRWAYERKAGHKRVPGLSNAAGGSV